MTSEVSLKPSRRNGGTKTSEVWDVYPLPDQYRKCELLTQEISKKKITPLLVTLVSHGKSEIERSERGVEKLLFVLEGTVTAKLEDKEYVLNPYDTIYFDASIPHQLVNTGGRQVKIFCAVSPSKI